MSSVMRVLHGYSITHGQTTQQLTNPALTPGHPRPRSTNIRHHLRSTASMSNQSINRLPSPQVVGEDEDDVGLLRSRPPARQHHRQQRKQRRGSPPAARHCLIRVPRDDWVKWSRQMPLIPWLDRAVSLIKQGRTDRPWRIEAPWAMQCPNHVAVLHAIHVIPQATHPSVGGGSPRAHLISPIRPSQLHHAHAHH